MFSPSKDNQISPHLYRFGCFIRGAFITTRVTIELRTASEYADRKCRRLGLDCEKVSLVVRWRAGRIWIDALRNRDSIECVGNSSGCTSCFASTRFTNGQQCHNEPGLNGVQSTLYAVQRIGVHSRIHFKFFIEEFSSNLIISSRGIWSRVRKTFVQTKECSEIIIEIITNVWHSSNRV